MLGNIFSIDKKDQGIRARASILEAKLFRQNEKLKKEIDGLYALLMEKELCILKLKHFISEELKKPDLQEDSPLLEEQLNVIFQDDYDPRIVLGKPEDNLNLNDSPSATRNPSFVFSSNQQEPAKQTTESNIKVVPADLKITDSPPLGPNDKSFESTDSASPSSPENKKNFLRQSILKRKEEKKKIQIKPIEQEQITRNLFSFELELKEYSSPTFDAVKQYVVKSSLQVDEIHDEIERLAEITAKAKYFSIIFPTETADKLADEIENYVFEILYPKLFIIDEDTRAYAQQFRDRINVLRNLVTFEVLELPVPLRNHALFTFSIRELEKMNYFKAPIWKLRAFQNAVNYIITVYNEQLHRDPNSDELFPILVYIVLHSNCDFIKYNVDYIYNHLRKTHLLGQFGFLIINLKAIIEFLQGIDGNCLAEGKLMMARR